MIKPDVILSWPRNTDYPVWRQMIRENRERFNEIIIVFTETNFGPDYRTFLKEAMFQDHVLMVQSPEIRGEDDWRNVAVNFGLMHSLHSEWIWFTEQDFFPSAAFWEEVEEHKDSFDVLAVYDDTRMHPCSILIRRETLNKTKKNFGIVKDELDHFGLVQKQLEGNDTIRIYKMIPYNYNHMAGLSHNMRLVLEGGKPNHRVDQFNQYLLQCMSVNVSVPSDLVSVIGEYLRGIRA